MVLSRAAVRRLDALAVERFGISGIVLMENAGRGVAGIVERLLAHRVAGPDANRLPAPIPFPSRPASQLSSVANAPIPIVILCGTGNNGGDGFVAARHLHNAGHTVRLGALGRPRPGSDAELNRAIWARMGLEVVPCLEALACLGESGGVPQDGSSGGSLGESSSGSRGASPGVPQNDPHRAPASSGAGIIVDALLGTGADRAPEGALLEVIEAINLASRRGAQVVAVDIPSGLDADTGRPLGSTAVRASVTATLAALKPGLLSPPGSDFCGVVECVDIGLPRGLVEEMVGTMQGEGCADGGGAERG